MTDVETLTERIRTIERAVSDDDHQFPAVDDLAELDQRVEAVEQRVAKIDERTAELESATQALRGYVGNVRSVNESVEQRADTALAATERLERRLDTVLDDRNEGTDRADLGFGQTDGRDCQPTKRPEAARSAPTRTASGTPDQSTEMFGPKTQSTNSTETDDHAEETTEPGVVEQIRSLL